MLKKIWEEKTKAVFVVLLAVGMLLFISIAVCGDYYSEMELRSERIMTVVGCVLSIIGELGVCVLGFFAYKKLEKPVKFNPILFALAAALWSYSLSELCMGAFFIKFYPLYNIMGFAIYAAVFLIGAAAFKRPKIWFCVWEVLFAVYSIAQYYLTKFRGAPIKFTDFANLRSAAEVKSEYKLTASFTVICALLEIAVVLFVTIRAELRSENAKPRLITLGAVAVLSAAFVLISKPSYDYGVNNRIIKLNFSGDEDWDTSRRVGSMLMFYYDGVYNHVQMPDDYTTEKGAGLTEKYPEEQPSGKTPVIIAVLNESFSDFSHISGFNTNKDYMPVIHSLSENTIKGMVTVSPYGGYTCNSEYEFLTGNTMHFLPLGSAVYTNYLESDQDSIVRALNKQGFETVAFTPCGPALWDIGLAYEYLGFKTKYFGGELGITSNELCNGQLPDHVLFERVCELADNRDRSKGIFFWVTTMQNHAPYNYEVEGGVELTDIEDEKAERYLNCVYQSDKALGEMIEHFKDYDEDVIIVMFGDHYPHIPSFSEKLYGGSLSGLNAEEYSRIHQTPFVIWSNRDIGSKELTDISLNYLGAEMFKAAGLPLTPIQQELEHIREKLPIVSGFGCRTDDGVWHAVGDDLGEDYDSALEEYRTMQYYRMFDDKRRIP